MTYILRIKKEIGIHLSKAARHLIYEEAISHSGPIPLCAVMLGTKVKVSFEYLENTDKECSLTNFELGGDGTFYPALAIRKGKDVYITCKQVTCPKRVRYAWCDSPLDINFYNESGLPAAGFLVDIQ